MQYSTNNHLKLMEGTDDVRRQDFVDNFNAIDNGLSKFYVATQSSTNVYKITTGANKTNLANGYSVKVAIPSDSNGAISLIVDSCSAVAVKKPNGNAVTNFKQNGVYSLTYYNSVFILASGGGADTVNFTSDKLLINYSANDSNGEKVDGTMPDNGAKTATLNCGGTYNIPKGYHNGQGKITANSLASQTSATADADKILSGYTAWVNGSKIIGNATIQSLGGMPVSYSGTNVFISHESSNKTVLIPKEQYDTSKSILIIIEFTYKGKKYIGSTVFGLGVSNSDSYATGTFKNVTDVTTSHNQNFVFAVGPSYGVQLYNTSSHDNESLNLHINYKIIYL